MSKLASLLNEVKAEVVQPLLNNFFTNINSNPSIINVATQAAALEVALVAALPNAAEVVVKDLSTSAQKDLAAAPATATAPATPAK